jgi:hypothetical protein
MPGKSGAERDLKGRVCAIGALRACDTRPDDSNLLKSIYAVGAVSILRVSASQRAASSGSARPSTVASPSPQL